MFPRVPLLLVVSVIALLLLSVQQQGVLSYGDPTWKYSPPSYLEFQKGPAVAPEKVTHGHGDRFLLLARTQPDGIFGYVSWYFTGIYSSESETGKEICSRLGYKTGGAVLSYIYRDVLYDYYYNPVFRDALTSPSRIDFLNFFHNTTTTNSSEETGLRFRDSYFSPGSSYNWKGYSLTLTCGVLIKSEFMIGPSNALLVRVANHSAALSQSTTSTLGENGTVPWGTVCAHSPGLSWSTYVTVPDPDHQKHVLKQKGHLNALAICQFIYPDRDVSHAFWSSIPKTYIKTDNFTQAKFNYTMQNVECASATTPDGKTKPLTNFHDNCSGRLESSARCTYVATLFCDGVSLESRLVKITNNGNASAKIEVKPLIPKVGYTYISSRADWTGIHVADDVVNSSTKLNQSYFHTACELASPFDSSSCQATSVRGFAHFFNWSCTSQDTNSSISECGTKGSFTYNPVLVGAATSPSLVSGYSLHYSHNVLGVAFSKGAFDVSLSKENTFIVTSKKTNNNNNNNNNNGKNVTTHAVCAAGLLCTPSYYYYNNCHQQLLDSQAALCRMTEKTLGRPYRANRTIFWTVKTGGLGFETDGRFTGVKCSNTSDEFSNCSWSWNSGGGGDGSSSSSSQGCSDRAVLHASCDGSGLLVHVDDSSATLSHYKNAITVRDVTRSMVLAVKNGTIAEDGGVTASKLCQLSGYTNATPSTVRLFAAARASLYSLGGVHVIANISCSSSASSFHDCDWEYVNIRSEGYYTYGQALDCGVPRAPWKFSLEPTHLTESSPGSSGVLIAHPPSNFSDGVVCYSVPSGSSSYIDRFNQISAKYVCSQLGFHDPTRVSFRRLSTAEYRIRNDSISITKFTCANSSSCSFAEDGYGCSTSSVVYLECNTTSRDAQKFKIDPETKILMSSSSASPSSSSISSPDWSPVCSSYFSQSAAETLCRTMMNYSITSSKQVIWWKRGWTLKNWNKTGKIRGIFCPQQGTTDWTDCIFDTHSCSPFYAVGLSCTGPKEVPLQFSRFYSSSNVATVAPLGVRASANYYFPPNLPAGAAHVICRSAGMKTHSSSTYPFIREYSVTYSRAFFLDKISCPSSAFAPDSEMTLANCTYNIFSQDKANHRPSDYSSGRVAYSRVYCGPSTLYYSSSSTSHLTYPPKWKLDPVSGQVLFKPSSLPRTWGSVAYRGSYTTASVTYDAMCHSMGLGDAYRNQTWVWQNVSRRPEDEISLCYLYCSRYSYQFYGWEGCSRQYYFCSPGTSLQRMRLLRLWCSPTANRRTPSPYYFPPVTRLCTLTGDCPPSSEGGGSGNSGHHGSSKSSDSATTFDTVGVPVIAVVCSVVAVICLYFAWKSYRDRQEERRYGTTATEPSDDSNNIANRPPSDFDVASSTAGTPNNNNNSSSSPSPTLRQASDTNPFRDARSVQHQVFHGPMTEMGTIVNIDSSSGAGGNIPTGVVLSSPAGVSATTAASAAAGGGGRGEEGEGEGRNCNNNYNNNDAFSSRSSNPFTPASHHPDSENATPVFRTPGHEMEMIEGAIRGPGGVGGGVDSQQQQQQQQAEALDTPQNKDK